MFFSKPAWTAIKMRSIAEKYPTNMDFNGKRPREQNEAALLCQNAKPKQIR